MRFTVIRTGTGYVGLVSGACLAKVGNEALCVDIDARISFINKLANEAQKSLPVNKIVFLYGSATKGRHYAISVLLFEPNTDIHEPPAGTGSRPCVKIASPSRPMTRRR